MFQAALILDEHFNNQYYRMHLWRRQLEIMSLLLFIEIGVTIWLINSEKGLPSVANLETAWPGILLFGLLGGTLSGLFPINNVGKNTKIPELLSNFLVMLLQVVIGAGSAFAAFFLIKAGLLSPSLVGILENPYALYAVSFIAGFNKRLVLKAVKGVAGEERFNL